MTDTREKLIISQKIKHGEESICPKCFHGDLCRARDSQPCYECNRFVDASGVTVQTADEQRNTYTVQEIEELQNEAYDLGADSVLHNRFGLSWDDAEGLRKEVARLQATAKWIPVTERLPRCGERVLITEGNAVFEASLSISHKWVRCGIGWAENITHWMPLPEPPKEAQ